MAICKHCEKQTSGKSKYCVYHRKQARENWRNMIAEKAQEKEKRDKVFAELFDRAHKAGKQAMADCKVIPMGVVDPRTGQKWTAKNGYCAYVSIKLYPGNSSLAHYAKKHWGATKAHPSGVSWAIFEDMNCAQKNVAYARAFTDVFQAAGYKMYMSEYQN